MISYRGLLGLLISLMFFVIAIGPTILGKEIPPMPMRLVSFFAGLFLALISILSIFFVFKRNRIVTNTKPVIADIYIFAEESSDSTSYTAQLKLSDSAWCIGIDPSRNVLRFVDGKIHNAEVWLDAKNRKPLGIAIEGKQINTLPVASEMNITDFPHSS